MNVFDTIIFHWLNSWIGIYPFFDWATAFRAVYLWYVVMAAVLLFPLISYLPRFRGSFRKNIELLVFAGISALAARFIFKEIIVFFYSRPRPFEALEGVRQLFPYDSGGSFPSGHAAFTFALAAAVSFYYPKTSILFFLAALNIGLARVTAGVHWPSDILGGALLGVGAVWLSKLIFKKFRK